MLCKITLLIHLVMIYAIKLLTYIKSRPHIYYKILDTLNSTMWMQ